MPDRFPPVQGGGSLLLAWQIRNKRVLVVGGGEVAAGRILSALNADAKVTVVAPRKGLNAEVAYRVDKGQVAHVDREFEPSDLEVDDGNAGGGGKSGGPVMVDMVLAAIDDPAASTRIWRLCRERRIAANIADVPPECDFYFGSVHRDGPLQVMVSTNGNGPKLAALVRRRIAAALPANVGAAVQKVGALRKKLRQVAPEPDEGPKRMKWMSQVCQSWSLEDLTEMDEKDMEALLEYYASGKVPPLKKLRGDPPEEPIGFDGSFGWW